ncbi:MAG: TIGR02117 family protein [Rhizobacter sp.]|nr:TIGR02117 family protein [Rhizobacter sp.]
MRLALKLLLRFLLALASLVAVYFATAFVLVFFPVNPEPRGEPLVVQAFVYSNGVHTDLVFPLHTQGVDWSQAFPAQHLPEAPHDAAYIAIGWGDREFYLNTPRWRDLTASRALQALSGSGRTLLHVSYLREADLQSGMHALPLSAQQYASLVNYVERALVRSHAGPGVNVPGQHYGAHDAFYEANGAYDLFSTCNAWVGRGLAQAGVKVSAWTPLATQVVWHLPRR